MKSRALTFLAVTSLLATTHAADQWQTIQGPDNQVSISIPAPVETKTTSNKTLAGTVLTTVHKYHGENEIYDFSFTKLPSLAVKIGGAEKIVNNAKGNVLHRTLGTETAFEKTTLNGQEAWHLEYTCPDHSDESHPGFHGEAYLMLVDDTLYVVNVTIHTEGSKDNLHKFFNSVSVSS
ncbi:MAG: hypothetical protein AAF591_04730 [Verrucomicrobiota bacterium]